MSIIMWDSGITQPQDRGILLKDILEQESGITALGGAVRGRYEEDGSIKQKLECNNTQKPNALTTVQKDNVVIQRPCKLRDFKTESTCHHVADATDISGNESIKRVYADTGKGPALTTMQGGHRQPKVLIVPEATKKGYTEVEDGDCFDLAIPGSKTRRGRNMKDKSNALLTSNAFMRYEHPTYRKLTVLECERLQTLPEGFTSVVSNSQAYKMIGNGWTIEVIKHIFKQLDFSMSLNNNKQQVPQKKKSSAAQHIPDVILESWNAQSLIVGGSLIIYKQLQLDYFWIYFAYAPTSKQFKTLSDEFLKRNYGIVEFRTNKPDLFKNHAIHIKDDMYRWIRD